jgi:general nucleoside transport system permease protein
MSAKGMPTSAAELLDSGRPWRLAALGGVVLGVLAILCTVPPVTLETRVVPAILALGAIGLGLLAIARGERFLGTYAIGTGILGAGLAFVIENAHRSTVVAIVTAGLFAGTLQYATPLTFGALGGLLSERAGVVNIGLEGMMLTGAFFGIMSADKTGSWELGLVGAAFFAALLALVHAIFAIHLRADQIVSGTAINILATGITAFAFQDIYGTNGTPNTPTIPTVHIANVPLLKQLLEAINWVLQKIPGVRSIATGVGNVFDSQNLMTWIALFLVVAAWLFLFRTTWGLRLRAVGEHPRAADTVGISVFRWRYLAVMSSGALAGLGGAYLSFGFLDAFTNQMTNGRGFIALAALVFGKWKPFGLLGATLLFGFASALGDQLQTNANISSDLVNILPYAFTLIALVGLVGRSTPPAADGVPYARQ